MITSHSSLDINHWPFTNQSLLVIHYQIYYWIHYQIDGRPVFAGQCLPADLTGPGAIATVSSGEEANRWPAVDQRGAWKLWLVSLHSAKHIAAGGKSARSVHTFERLANIVKALGRGPSSLPLHIWRMTEKRKCGLKSPAVAMKEQQCCRWSYWQTLKR